jgi:outer membrane receptor protein involved in Fe transport
MHKIVLALVTVTALITFSTTARGQVTGGSVTGTVADSQGAVIPNATVNLSNKATGQKLTTQTTDSGSYNFPNVPVGDYTITFENSGFTPANQDVKVSLNQAAVVDATLQAAGATATVNVTAASEALVQTESSVLSRSFETRQVENLPIFGDQNALALLSPNVVQRSAGVLGSGGSVGGTRARGNTFTVDGVDNNDASVTGPVVNVIQDAVQEFTLLTNNYSAEFGAGAGGQFNTITKTGTNEFHGSGFYYAQSEKFNAASTSEEDQINAGTLTKLPRFRDYRYGFTFGGPIVKNRFFFFGAYERNTQNSAAGSAEYVAPTAAGLTQIAALPGVSQFVVNLLRNNVQLAPAAEFLNPVLGTPVPFGTAIINFPSGFKNNLLQINADHLPNSRDQFRYRFNFQKFRAEQPGGGFVGSDPKFNNLVAFDARLFSATWVRTFSPSVVNDLRLSYRRSPVNFPLKDPQFNNFPNIFDFSTGIDIGPSGSLPQGTPVDNNYQVFDTVSYTRGNHSFKFGGEFRRLIYTSAFLPRARGDYGYADFDELITDTAPSFINLRGVGDANFVGNQSVYSAFGQDDWKVTPNLTLNLGLRYEYASLPRAAKLQALNSVASVPGVIEFGVPKTDKNNFAPRVGFAYSPEGDGRVGRFFFGERGESSIRANFAITYYPDFQNLVLLNQPPQVQTELNIQSAAFFFGTGTTAFLQNGGLPNSLPPTDTPARARASTGSRIEDFTTSYTISWTLSYQRQLTPTTAIEFRYLSTRGRNLPVQARLNTGNPVVNSSRFLPTFFSQPTPAQLAGLTTTLGNLNALRRRALAPFGFLGEVTNFSRVGNSQYDGGSVSLTRRFDRGLGFTAAYTWSKTIDDSTNELNSSAVNPRRPQNVFNMRDERGLSALDIPHRFAASFNYDVPFFNKSSNKFLKTLLGGFQLNGIFQAQSGQPFTPISGVDSNLSLDSAADRAIFNPSGVEGTGSSVRAINAAGATVPLGSASTVAYVVNNPNAQYIQAGQGALANAGRNTLRSRGFNRTDAVFLKNTTFFERYTLQLGVEVFDLFNQRPQTLGTGNLHLNGTFAVVGNNSLFNNYNLGDFPGRTIQMRAKFIF